jgi:hypothetical protein
MAELEAPVLEKGSEPAAAVLEEEEEAEAG